VAEQERPSCEDALTELYTFLDGELTAEKREHIAHHLDDCNPWLERYPLGLSPAVPVRREDSWAVADGEGRLLPLRRGFALGWELRAVSGGSPIGLFGEWDGESLLPLSASAGGRLIAL